MSLTVSAEAIPLATDAFGVIRVAGTRIPLETVVYSFRSGASPETIVEQYSSLGLADVYFVLGYCLRNAAAVESYLQRRKAASAQVRAANERRFPPDGVRARLLARQPGGA